MKSTAMDRKKWRKTANRLAKRIGSAPTSERAGQEEHLLTDQDKMQIRFLARTLQYPIMDKLDNQIPASCPCGNNFKIEGRAQERVSSHFRSHWPYSHIGFGYELCDKPNCIQYFKRADHSCKCSSSSGHKSGRKRHNYPMMIESSGSEDEEESGEEEEEEGLTDYESDEESYQRHGREREQKKKEKQKSTVKKAIEGMSRKRPVVEVEKFELKRKKYLRTQQKKPSYQDLEDSSSDDSSPVAGTSESTSAEETSSDDEPREETHSQKEKMQQQMQEFREKRVEKRHKSWCCEDEEWLPEVRKKEVRQENDEKLAVKKQRQDQEEKEATLARKRLRKSKKAEAEKSPVKEMGDRGKKRKEPKRENHVKSQDRTREVRKRMVSEQKKERGNTIRPIAFGTELRRLALANAEKNKREQKEKNLKMRERKKENLKKATQPAAELLRVQEKENGISTAEETEDDNATGSNVREKHRSVQREETLMRWALQSDSGSTSSTPREEASHSLEEENGAILINWEEKEVLVVDGEEVLEEGFQGSTIIQVVETGVGGEEAARTAMIEVFDHTGGDRESLLKGVGEERRRNLERRMMEGGTPELDEESEEEAGGYQEGEKEKEVGTREIGQEGNLGCSPLSARGSLIKQKVATQEAGEEEEGGAAPAKVRSLVDPCYDEEDSEEDEVGEPIQLAENKQNKTGVTTTAEEAQ